MNALSSCVSLFVAMASYLGLNSATMVMTSQTMGAFLVHMSKVGLVILNANPYAVMESKLVRKSVMI